MKLLYLIFCAALVALGAGEIIAPDSLANETFAKGTRHATFDDHVSTKFVDLAAVWFKAVCNGQKLFQAMTTPADTAARFITPVHSSFDGTLTRELRDWGYNEDVSFLDAEKCDFDDVKRAFDDMQIGIRSQSRGGPNQCFQVNHYDGPTVLPGPDGQQPAIDSQRYPGPDGVIRRVTGAHATIGVNAASGVIFFIDLESPYEAALDLWFPYHPQANDLPRLRLTSDFAWGFWNRAKAGHLRDIRKTIVLDVINPETKAIIQRILNEMGIPGPRAWPGTTIALDGDVEGLALLGSPNGVGTGYFLAQHKNQLGGNKVVSRITIFRADADDQPCLVFWVADRPETPMEGGATETSGAGNVESRVVRRSADGRSVVREHVFLAKL